MNPSRQHVDTLVFVPLPEEMAALCAQLPAHFDEKVCSNYSYRYWNNLNLSALVTSLVAIVPFDWGNQNASLATNAALEEWNPELVVIMGIGGQIDGMKLGDVLVARYVFQYDTKRKEQDTPKGRVTRFAPIPVPISPLGANAANLMLSNEKQYSNWQQDCFASAPKSLRPREVPKLFIDDVASGDAVVDSVETKASISAISRKINIVETEAAGVVAALRIKHPLMPVVVIRGVSDYAANKAATDKRKNGQWRIYAASNGSRALFVLLENYLIKAIKHNKTTSVVQNVPDSGIDMDDFFERVVFDIYSPDSEPYYYERALDGEIERIAKNSSIWLYGSSGNGKTCALKRLIYRKQQKFIYITLGVCASGGARECILQTCEALLSAIGQTKKVSPVLNRAISETQQVLVDHIATHPLRLYIDEIPLSEPKQITIFTQGLLGLLWPAMSSPRVRILISSIYGPEAHFTQASQRVRERMKFIESRRWESADLEGLLRKLKNSLGDSLDTNALRMIVDSANGSPRFVKQFLRNKRTYPERSIQTLLDQTRSERLEG